VLPFAQARVPPCFFAEGGDRKYRDDARSAVEQLGLIEQVAAQPSVVLLRCVGGAYSRLSFRCSQ
jgi:hypothetical protein